MAENTQAIIDEIQFLLSQSKQPDVRILLEEELRRQQVHLKTVSPPEKKEIVKPTVRTKKITNYAWDENKKFVKIYVSDIKQTDDTIDKENIESRFSARSANVTLRRVGSKELNYTFSIANLYNDISPEECKVTPTKTGVTIYLAKKNSSTWGSIKASKDEKKDEPPMPAMDKDADPGAGLMNLMKHMYDSGDDEMKRTIAKSMYESQNKQRSGGGMGDMELPDMGDMGAGLDQL